jgi:hypothetical protein
VNFILLPVVDATPAVSYIAAITAQDKREVAGPATITRRAVDMLPIMRMRRDRSRSMRDLGEWAAQIVLVCLWACAALPLYTT